MRAAWTSIALVCAPPALAWPVDVKVELLPGAERFEKPNALAWAEVEDEKVASAEVLPTGELLLTGRAAGSTLLLLYAEGKVAVWKLTVGPKPKPTPIQPLPECPKLEVTASRVEGPVADDRCRRALLSFFERAPFTSHDLALTFTVPALQAQLQSIDEGLKVAARRLIKSSYRGAGLSLEGEVTPAEHRQVLWQLFKRSAGRVVLDDRLVVSADALSDGGTPKP